VVDAGSGGARDTALASMRWGSSRITVMNCRFGKSGDVGGDQPSCAISPHTGGCGGINMPWSSFSETVRFL
jgi:hypothetical protein